MQHPFRSLSRTARAFVLAVILSGIAVWSYALWDSIRNPIGPAWLILVALTVAGSTLLPRIPNMPVSFSISDTLNIAAALLFGPSAGAITAAVDGWVLTSRFASNQRTADRILFNMAAPSIAIWVAAQVFFALGGNRPELEGSLTALRLLALLTLFGAVDFGLNGGIVAIAVGLERNVSMLSVWRAHLAGVWITYFGGIFGAMLVMLLARYSTLEMLILIIPLPVILYVTFRHSLGRATDQIDHLAKVNRVYVGAIEALAHAVGAKDEVTHDHTRRVQDRSVGLARAMGVDDDGEIQAIKAASLLHDVGKLAIPEHILNKPGRLTPAEYEIMKRHAPIGADILSVIGFPFAVAPIVRHHHENWDGSGYPDGLSGEAIPVGSRILAVVDCFDALTSDRPYRPRMDDREALQIISDRRGTMYDPRVVDIFFEMHGAFAVSSAPPVAEQKPSALQAPLRAGADHLELDLQTFFEFGRALTSPASLAEVGEIVWKHFRSRLPASAVVLYEYDSGDDCIVSVYEAAVGGHAVRTRRIRLGERLSGWVAATRQIAVNSDARLDLDDAVREASALRSALAVPVLTNGRCAGVLTFYACESSAFDETHRRLAAVAGSVIARPLTELASARVPSLASGAQNSTRVFGGQKLG
jgi:putative nucleotidyltransferase with HDIG domain